MNGTYEKAVKFIKELGFPIFAVCVLSFILYRHITVTEVIIQNNTDAVESLHDAVDDLKNEVEKQHDRFKRTKI